MFAHKVDGEHPSSYSNLFLATQKMERWAEARKLSPKKMATTSGSNTMCSQTPGSLFPLHKLKSNCTCIAQAVTIRNDMAEENPGVE